MIEVIIGHLKDHRLCPDIVSATNYAALFTRTTIYSSDSLYCNYTEDRIDVQSMIPKVNMQRVS